jgi:hypothetical protein
MQGQGTKSVSKITKRAVDALVLRDGKQAVLWDSEVKGFGVRVRAGGSKSYVLHYRPGSSGRAAPQRTLTIGTHGSPWTPDSVRLEANLTESQNLRCCIGLGSSR